MSPGNVPAQRWFASLFLDVWFLVALILMIRQV